METNLPLDLTVVMPVYNEEGSISTVIPKWISLLREHTKQFEFCVFDDGSKDNSLLILQGLAAKYPELRVISKPNSGHGPTILQGYREARGEWIFQIDSDDEIGSSTFTELWEARGNADLGIGFRVDRQAQLSRRIVSLFSRWTVICLYGGRIKDMNCPFRMYRRERFEDIVRKLPVDTFAPNVILSGWASANHLRIREIPVSSHFRTTGEVSIKKWKLVKAALRSWVQTVRFWWAHDW